MKSILTLLPVTLIIGCASSKPTQPGQVRPTHEASTESASAGVRTEDKAHPKPGLPLPPKSAELPAARPDLMPGTDCTTAKMPELKYDSDEHQVRLANGGFKMRLPKGWKAELERPDLVVITSPESSKGVRPVFEMFVSPVCKKYESFVVHQRVASRGLSDLLPADDTIEQINSGHWKVGLGGQVGQNLILQDVTLKTKKGERAVIVYATKLGDAKNFGLRAAAVCPKPGKKEGPLGKCEKTYYEMLGKAEF